MNTPSVNAFFNTLATESVAAAGNARLTDTRHANCALEMLIEDRNLQ